MKKKKKKIIHILGITKKTKLTNRMNIIKR